jgi:DNA (cytosine-5)-methyltransferase 1
MNGLSLFSGGGIGELAFKQILPNYRTVGYVEWDKYCQAVIRARIRDGVLDDAPIFGDIREFNARYASLYAGKVDWLSAGFPCQPFSVAGRQLGEADERNQWPATRDAISIIRPRYVFLENVSGLFASQYIWGILADFTNGGYDAEWDRVGADQLEMRHHRSRGWILLQHGLCGKQELVGEVRRNGGQPKQVSWDAHRSREGEPPMVGVAHGVASRVDRLKALGNGWVPQVVRRILEVENV